MKTRKDYQTEAIRLSKAIDIAVEAVQKHPPKELPGQQLQHFIKWYLENKEEVLNPKPEYKSLASLKYSIQDVFIFFNETSGSAVEYFWKHVHEQELGYERTDYLAKIFERGKIRGRIEYEFAVDVIGVYAQEGRISSIQVSDLGRMISEFEKRRK